MIAALRHAPPTVLVLGLMTVLTLFRLLFINVIQLVPDEAYYWLWAERLDWSYRDKGPLVAWAIALGTAIFGDTVFGIRIFAVLLAAGLGWLVYLIARRLYDEQIGLWCVITGAVMPIVAVGAIVMTIDSLCLLFWAWAVLLFWEVIHSNRSGTWFWLGVLIGLGFLAKFTNGVQFICIGFFLLWSREHRHLLFGRGVWIMSVAFAITILPLVIWNIGNGGVHVMALVNRSGAESGFTIKPGELLEFIGGQFGVVSPLIMLGMVIAAGSMLIFEHQDLRVRFLMSQFLPVYGLFLFFSLNEAGQPNWPAPALVTGLIFTVVYWRGVLRRSPGWRRGVIAALSLAFVMSVAMHDTTLLMKGVDAFTAKFGLKRAKDPLRRARGWTDFADHVQRARETHQPTLLLGNHYSQPSMMTFYLPDRPWGYLWPEPFGSSQFSLWPRYTLTPESRALFVTDTDTPVYWYPGMTNEFRKFELVDDFVTQHNGRPMTRFWIWLCTEPNVSAAPPAVPPPVPAP